MSLMPKKISIERSAIDNIETVEDVKTWLKGFVREFDRWYDKLYDHIENGGYATKTWRTKDATAADVAAGKAEVVGDLMEQRKIAGVWTTLRLNLGS